VPGGTETQSAGAVPVGSGSATAASAVVEEVRGLDRAIDAPLPASAEPSRATKAVARAGAAGADPEGSAVISEPEPRLRGSSFGQPAALLVNAGELRFDGARAHTLTAGAALGPIPRRLVPRYDLAASLASFVTPPGGASNLFGPFQVHWAVLGPVQMRRGWSLATGFDGAGVGSLGFADALALDGEADGGEAHAYKE
jgi:hypothetical protein